MSMAEVLIVLNIVVTVAGAARVLIKIGRVLERQDVHETQLRNHARRIETLEARR